MYTYIYTCIYVCIWRNTKKNPYENTRLMTQSIELALTLFVGDLDWEKVEHMAQTYIHTNSYVHMYTYAPTYALLSCYRAGVRTVSFTVRSQWGRWVDGRRSRIVVCCSRLVKRKIRKRRQREWERVIRKFS